MEMTSGRIHKLIYSSQSVLPHFISDNTKLKYIEVIHTLSFIHTIRILNKSHNKNQSKLPNKKMCKRLKPLPHKKLSTLLKCILNVGAQHHYSSRK